MPCVKEIMGFIRAPFLLLPPACVLLGYAATCHDNFKVDVNFLLLALAGAMFSHISVNAFNEYADFRSGLDSKTIRTPFSGGSGTLQKNPSVAVWALSIAIGSALLVAGIGLFFTIVHGWGIVPLGLAGLALVLTYSFWIVKNPLFCLVAPGLGFGTFIVMGTYFALTGTYSWTAALVSTVPFFLVSNLLLLNQYPDVEADRFIGRKNLPVIAGTCISSIVYTVFIVGAYAVIIAGVVYDLIPVLSLISMVTVPLSILAVAGAFRNSKNALKLIPSMGLNVIVNILTPVLLSIGIFLG